ncbi:hypothetical protein AVEN_43656-1 [Araneus ventricosus]|uniref:Uncharacterized protein n=1 Tax=Araneus ventricosus TaxID=182803 RepID=A0A4Y2SEP6_ARAVE|nr:hypothetical protein AVEN_43656-1 [Araneus ventricosus]
MVDLRWNRIQNLEPSDPDISPPDLIGYDVKIVINDPSTPFDFFFDPSVQAGRSRPLHATQIYPLALTPIPSRVLTPSAIMVQQSKWNDGIGTGWISNFPLYTSNYD